MTKTVLLSCAFVFIWVFPFDLTYRFVQDPVLIDRVLTIFFLSVLLGVQSRSNWPSLLLLGSVWECFLYVVCCKLAILAYFGFVDFNWENAKTLPTGHR